MLKKSARGSGPLTGLISNTDSAESYGKRGYRSLSMSAVVDEYERMQALTNLLHQESDKIVEVLVADDSEKAAEVWRLLGERLAPSMFLVSSPPILFIYACGHGSEKPHLSTPERKCTGGPE